MIATAALVAVAAPLPAAADPPPGFVDELVASIDAPSPIAFTPDGRLLVATLPGLLYVVDAGQVLATPALDLSAVVCTNGERGMLGLAVDPEFALNRHVFLYYTFANQGSCETQNAFSPVNRVSRFRLKGSGIIDPASERVLIDDMPSFNGNHNGGDLRFGLDGNLYVTIGDGGCDYALDSLCGPRNDASRDQNILLGKVLRITRSGGIPAGNPNLGPGTARCARTGGHVAPGLRCRETFASGFRNPFRLGLDPVSGRIFVNDVGQSTWEEIDILTAGADYGWNLREGFCAVRSTTDCGPPPEGLTNPIHAYPHNGCTAITGGAVVPPGSWGPDYEGDYIFADFACKAMFRLEEDAGTWTATTFSDPLPGKPVHLVFGPSELGPALYYSTLVPEGAVRRIVLTEP